MATDKRGASINTAEEAQANPVVISADALMRGTSMIRTQKARGQHSFVSSTTLPTNIREGREVLEAAGVKFGEVVENDPLFQYVELPRGWKKVPIEHSMWSELVDDKGRKRASIFYKAAFYYRDAFLNVVRRFAYGLDYDREDKEHVWVAQILDCGQVIYTTEPIPIVRPEEKEEWRTIAETWLDEHYPNWRDPGAYWD